MVKHIISFSIKNKLIVGLFTLFLIGWGIYSLSKISIDAVPDITNNQVQIITTSRSLAAQEVEQFITYPVELAMANLPGLIEIRSISRFGLSVVTVVFEENMGTYLPRQLVAEKLKEAQDDIGDQFGVPNMVPITTGLGEIYQYTLETKPGYEDTYSPTELRSIQDWIVKRQLSMIPGVVEINSFGGFLKQYEVAIDPEKLNAYNLTLPEVFTALEENNENTGGSYIEKDPEMFYIRGKGLVKSLDDIRKIVVTKKNSIPVTMADIGKVQFGTAPRFGAATKDGNGETVIGVVMMLKDANSAKVIEAVKERVAEIQKTLPEGLYIKPFLDRTKLVNKTIGTVQENLLIGGIIVILALIFLLGTWRAGFIVASVIPLSMLFALGMMKSFGISANLLSLGALDFGIIVDGAVIIVEFMAVQLVKKHSRLKSANGKEKKNLLDKIAIKSSTKMMNAAIFGQIIILIVFLPIMFLTEVEGKMFRPMALAFSFAILGALILCLTYVPMISAVLLHSKSAEKKSWGDRFMEKLQNFYEPIIKWALEAKVLVISIALILLIGAVFIFSNLGGEFIPKLDEGDFALETRMGPGISLNEMKKNMTKLEKILLEFPEVESVVTKIGAAEIPTDPVPVEASDIMVSLKPKDEWTSAETKEELAEKMSEALEVIPGLSVEFSQPIEMRFNELLTGIKSDVAVKIYGENLDTLQQKGNEAAAIIQQISGSADVKAEQVTGLPQIIIDYNRDRLAQYDLNISELNQVVNTAFAGATAGTIYEGERRFDMVVRLQDRFRHDIEAVRNLYVPLKNGKKIPLREVAAIKYKEAPAQISRDNTRRRVVVGVNVRNRDTESLVNEIQQKLEKNLRLPPGYNITYGGQFKNLQRAKKRLGVVIPVALGLIFIILFISLRSFQQTLLIYTAIPFAAVGGVLALWLRGMPFSISAGVGFIALFGVAVLNGLVLIESLNELKEEGIENRKKRIVMGTKSRLRPIFLTAVTDILGFIPMAVSSSSGAEVQRPLATVVIGGLFTATMLTLVVLPVLYSLIDRPMNFKRLNPKSLLLVLLLLPIVAAAQERKVDSLKMDRVLSLEEAMNIGLSNNGDVEGADFLIESKRAQRKSAFDPGKTDFEYEFGQTNGFENDNSITISQNFDFPGVYSARSGVFESELKTSEIQKEIAVKRLKTQIKSAFYSIWYLKEKRELLIEEDSLFEEFVDAAKLRFQTGETNQLEKIRAQAKKREIENELFQIEVKLQKQRTDFSAFLGIHQNVDILRQGDLKLSYLPPVPNDSISSNPELKHDLQQIETAKKNTHLEKARLGPDFWVGYSNQSQQGNYDINGSNGYIGKGTRFESAFIGVSIPIWFHSQAARVKASKKEAQAAQSRYEQAFIETTARYKKIYQEYLGQLHSLEIYEESLLQEANIIMRDAWLGYRAGETGYTEFVQSIEQAMDIKKAYLETINSYNQTIIDLQYLYGK